MAQLEDEHSIQQAKRFLVLGNTTEFFERVLSRILVKQAPHPVKEALEFVNEYIKEVPDSTSTDQVKTDATTLRYRPYVKRGRGGGGAQRIVDAFFSPRPN